MSGYPWFFFAESLLTAIAKAIIPIYASVLPPPVGNHNKSAISLDFLMSFSSIFFPSVSIALFFQEGNF